MSQYKPLIILLVLTIFTYVQIKILSEIHKDIENRIFRLEAALNTIQHIQQKLEMEMQISKDNNKKLLYK